MLSDYSTRVRMRHRYSFGPSIPFMGREDEKENEAPTELHLWPWSRYGIAQYWPGSDTHKESAYRRYYL